MVILLVEYFFDDKATQTSQQDGDYKPKNNSDNNRLSVCVFKLKYIILSKTHRNVVWFVSLIDIG
jgi:hypothetical protein